MTTSTTTPDRRCDRRRRARAGFSLIELTVAVSIASMALAAVFSTTVFISRSAVATTDYADMTMEARRALELFARDVRMAKDVTAFSEHAVTLTVRTSSGTKSVNYTYLPGTKTFYRNFGTSDQQRLITHIESLALTAYGLATDPDIGQPLPANQPIEIKQLQLQLRSVRSGGAKATASNNVVSARFILRNKLPK